MTISNIITKQQNIEFGLVTILITSILAYSLGYKSLILLATILSLVTILIPALFTPFSAVWYKFSHAIGIIGSSILLGFIFFFIVTPVACIRRILRKDSLQLKLFRKTKDSVLINRNHLYKKDDLIHTF